MLSSTNIKLIVGAAAVVGIFLVGFVPQYRRASEMESRLSEAQTRIESLESGAKLARLRDLASGLFLETVNQNFGLASGRASELFNHVRSVASDPGMAAYRETLDWILAQRDAVIGNLAKSDPSARTQVQEILERALKISGPSNK